MARDHVVIPILKYLLDSYEDEIECETCKYQGISTVAVGYCTDCEVPEPLCTSCIRQHEAQRWTRSHKISNNVSTILSASKATNPTCAIEKMSELHNGKRDVTPQSIRETVEIETEQSEACSKPTEFEIKQDSLKLIWEHPYKRRVELYQIRYRIKNDRVGKKWKTIFTKSSRNNAVISGLRSDTTYEFQVRPVYDDTEGPYSLVSDPVTTLPSLASIILDFCTKIQDGGPYKIPVYRLNTTELQDARNPTAKTRKVVIGEENKHNTNERTIMLVGETGSGKRTLVDALVNYFLGVSFDDPFRFKLVTLEEEEGKQRNQNISHTEWITSYTIHPHEDGRHDFKINIIDTPGFGDTRGRDRNTAIVRQINDLFLADEPKGVAFIDTVCFLAKAPDAHLTVTQKYILHSVMSLFGNDISSNICTLITFSDGGTPPVLSALKEVRLPFGKWFPFNNSGLFVKDENLSPMLWAMCHESFKSLFEHIETLKPKEVLEHGQCLQSTNNFLQSMQGYMNQMD